MTTEDKLQALREEWKRSPKNRELILRRVKALQYSQTPYKHKQTKENEQLVDDVIP